MIVDERMRTYINSLNTGNTDFLEELEQTALETGVPVIRRDVLFSNLLTLLIPNCSALRATTIFKQFYCNSFYRSFQDFL